MAKVFRLHSKDDTIIDWGTSCVYDDGVIKQILDPNGASSKNEITSIPSPFARMDLVKTAFLQVVNSQNLEGDSIHHKLVSDCFDVGEIFFNYEKLRDRVEIIVWDKKNELNLLKESANAKHRLFGETLEMYLDQDAQTYNFDKLNRIYLLNYIGTDKPHQMNIIGATSPATFFFTSANKLDYVSRNIQFGNDHPFDDFYQPLYNRDIEYIKYWFCIKNFWGVLMPHLPGFADLFPEIDGYLDLTYTALLPDQKQIIDNLKADAWSKEFDDITLASANDYVEIFNYNLKKKKKDTDRISKISDFVIHTGKNINAPKPLVLPVDTYLKPLNYTQDKWNKDTKVPYKNELPLNQRILPADGTQYPYLTMGDFLEDTIICSDYTFNKEFFFDGNDGVDDHNHSYSYFLPVKKEYFDYFTVEDLKKAITLERRNVGKKSVKVSLRIPVSKEDSEIINYITYEKIYFEKDSEDSDISGKEGNIVNKRFSLALFPHLKFPAGVDAQYRVSILDRLNRENIKLFYSSMQDNKLSKPKIISRNQDEERHILDKATISSSTYIIESNFDYLELQTAENYKALVIPFYAGSAGSDEFVFAVDFGTSNTHIEYRRNSEESKPFDIQNAEKQIQVIHSNAYDDKSIKKVLFTDFIPEIIGSDSKSEYHFPVRTVMAEAKNTDWQKPAYPMATANIPLVYEKIELPAYNKIKTDLKWATDKGNMERIKCYLGTLFLLMRNKVLMNGGSLKDSKVVWFYPASMSEDRIKKIRSIWKELYKTYFGGVSQNMITMSESVAPYYYYKMKEDATSNVVSIDIGGGTSDVVIVEDGAPKYLTSFRFAANAIFGDGHISNIQKNGFIKRFKPEIVDKLSKNDLEDLIAVLDSIMEKGTSTDVIAFFFSLLNNSDVRAKDIQIDFNKILSDDPKCKIIFILFYSAMIYHIAQIMHAKEMDEPRYLAFSGTGSKILQVLVDVKEDIETLEKYTKLIFQKVYQKLYPGDGLTIIIDPDKPKESTCKGGLLKQVNQDLEELENMKLTLLGVDDKTFAEKNLKYEDVKDKKSMVADEVARFMKLVFELDKEFPFKNKFGAESTENLLKLKPFFTRDIEKFVGDGMKNKQEEDEASESESKVCETLFFYPLIGVLNVLACEIYKR